MAVIKGSNGQVAEVDTENRLSVFSVSEPFDKHRNTEQKAWALYFTNTPTGANDNFFYLKNTGTKDIYIQDIRISSTVPTQVFYNHVSGDAVGGTAITPTNRYLGSSITPVATIEQGINITGLVDIGTVFFEECDVANRMYSLRITSNIIVPQGQAVAFKRVEATGLINCVVSMVEAE